MPFYGSTTPAHEHLWFSDGCGCCKAIQHQNSRWSRLTFFFFFFPKTSLLSHDVYWRGSCWLFIYLLPALFSTHTVNDGREDNPNDGNRQRVDGVGVAEHWRANSCIAHVETRTTTEEVTEAEVVCTYTKSTEAITHQAPRDRVQLQRKGKYFLVFEQPVCVRASIALRSGEPHCR